MSANRGNASPTLLQRIKAPVRRSLARAVPDRAKPLLRRLAGRSPSPSRPDPVRDARRGDASHDTAQVRAYYEEMTPAYLAGFGEIFQGSRPESTDALIDHIIAAAAIEDGMRILDAGCGIGGPAMAIAARRNVRIEGLTLAQAQVDCGNKLIGERALGDRVTLRQGDFHDLARQYKPASFDRILFLESICHAESYADVLRGARDLLKPGGALYIKDFHCVDNRSRPAMSEGQARDLARLHEVYRLQMPDLASMVDVLSGLGLMIGYMRMPDYEPTYTHWAAYEREAGRGWHPQSAEPGDIIQAVEFLCWKRA